jgi:hypothetical protein
LISQYTPSKSAQKDNKQISQNSRSTPIILINKEITEYEKQLVAKAIGQHQSRKSQINARFRPANSATY